MTRGSVAILVHRIGFLPARIAVTAPAADVTVQLSEAPLGLDALTVRAEGPIRCPSRDEPIARLLWEEAARRYSRATDSIWLRSEKEVVSGEGPRDQIGDTTGGTPRSGHRETGAYRRAVDPRLGYGYRISGSIDAVEAAWHYMALGSHDAQHFIDPSFGIYNVLAVVSRTPARTVLGFCSRGLGRGAVPVAGTLSIAAEGTLAEARWRFDPPAPREEAGGQVVFAPYSAGGVEGWLVPAQSLLWRRVLGFENRYRHQTKWYARWVAVPPRR
ncbi:MAG: hypothetical protein ICV87_10220 [Gemmatimonadetes bacterium]|nr:hypothetical protein [Gemmatimonadota bacterium]